jgi:hypothetical protein
VVGQSQDLQPPLVVQQFVEHGGVLYKVRVLCPCARACARSYVCMHGGQHNLFYLFRTPNMCTYTHMPLIT